MANEIKVKEYYDRLAKGVEEILEKDAVKDVLRAAQMFHKYSFANTIMILIQRPDAARVAGFQTWKRLGRWVKAKERGIAIYIPIFKKIGKNKKGARSEYDADLTADTDGKLTDNNAESILVGFRIGYVFDVTQTEGNELASVPELKGEMDFTLNHGDAALLYEKILNACPVPVNFGQLEDKTKGYYNPNRPNIVLSNSLTVIQRPSVLLHEMAHHYASTMNISRLGETDRMEDEVVGEGAAFMVSCHYGLDTTRWSFPYVAAWGRDVRKVLLWGRLAQKVAATMIDAIESAGRMKKAA